MDSAVAVGLVVEGTRPWSWRFTHALVQEVLVGGLPALRRARLHARLGAALERRGPRHDALVERLAHHFVEALPVAGPAPARRYLAGAAQAARARLAHGEAAAHTRQALRLLDPAEPDAARTRHDLLTALGNDLLRSGQLMEAREVVGEAITVARQLDDRRMPGPGGGRLGQRDGLELAAARHGRRRHGRPARGPDRRAGPTARRSGDRPAARHPRHRARLRAGRPRGAGRPSARSSWPGGSGIPSCSAGP